MDVGCTLICCAHVFGEWRRTWCNEEWVDTSRGKGRSVGWFVWNCADDWGCLSMEIGCFTWDDFMWRLLLLSSSGWCLRLKSWHVKLPVASWIRAAVVDFSLSFGLKGRGLSTVVVSWMDSTCRSGFCVIWLVCAWQGDLIGLRVTRWVLAWLGKKKGLFCAVVICINIVCN